VKLIDVEVENEDEVHESGFAKVGEQSVASETPSASKSSRNVWLTPPVLERCIVMLSP
jgi:hypothetical protein